MNEPRRVNKRTRILVLGLVVLLISLWTGTVQAGSSTHYAVPWQVLSGGGAPVASSSGGVTLNASLGQTAIGISTSSGGGTVLGAGYWYGILGGERLLYLPLVLRGY